MVVGDCVPTGKMLEMVVGFLGSLHEAYIKSDNTAIVMFHGEVEDGTIKLPEHTHAAFDGKKVFVGAVWSKPPECAHCANHANSEICSECRDYDHFKPAEKLLAEHPAISEARREAARMDK